MITLIQIAFIIVLAYLVKTARNRNATREYIFVLIGGLVTFIFGPLIGQNGEGAIDAGVQIICTVFGIYCIIWSIIRMIKGKKESVTDTKIE